MKRILTVFSLLAIFAFLMCGCLNRNNDAIDIEKESSKPQSEVSVSDSNEVKNDDYKEKDSIPDTPDEVWGELEENEGGVVYGTLTKEQQELVNYPPLDENSVYWTAKGENYHSINWCYTLAKSKEIFSGSIEEAIKKGKTSPCSKCVGE